MIFMLTLEGKNVNFLKDFEGKNVKIFSALRAESFVFLLLVLSTE